MNENPRRHHSFSSSWVDEAWYDDGHKLLEVAFDDGVHWLYDGVTKAIWDSFISSGSAGRFVREELASHSSRAK